MTPYLRVMSETQPSGRGPAGRGPADILPLVRRLKARLAEAYGDRLAGVVLFGSYARGEATPESDVDLLVVLDGPVDRWAEIGRLAEIAVEVEDGTGEMLSLLARSAADVDAASTPLLRNVRAEGIPA